VLFHVVFFKIIIIICYFSTLPFVVNKDFHIVLCSGARRLSALSMLLAALHAARFKKFLAQSRSHQSNVDRVDPRTTLSGLFGSVNPRVYSFKNVSVNISSFGEQET